ncbi:MAG: DUF3109 family protein [Ignavibacteria bacterium]|nr:DUF3109 family protein [Ignavibacteria bacterium]MBT8383769.1 DUF3109 family protein [Ignavibacteria bacterium]MBT8391774.1 DUF3109 family protein [Ignavibacteria bacterium]NNJ52346.1 DUF3109 family protein [Ignavibacteriaceae bacterium]NNL21079.1 DUF3109 family protein [Ignavibacteriaceae bacterium]
MNEQFLPVFGVLVRQEIAETHFKCDLQKCKGACCTFQSRYGAPLANEEIKEIEKILNIVKNYLSPAHLKEIEKNGFYEEKNNEFMTQSINNHACVFVCYEDGVAKCAIEKAYLDGKTNFKKPISCHLFPIRRSDFGGDILKYEKLDECDPALDKGLITNTTIADFCEEPLNKLYGKKWYSQLMESIGR